MCQCWWGLWYRKQPLVSVSVSDPSLLAQLPSCVALSDHISGGLTSTSRSHNPSTDLPASSHHHVCMLSLFLGSSRCFSYKCPLLMSLLLVFSCLLSNECNSIGDAIFSTIQRHVKCKHAVYGLGGFQASWATFDSDTGFYFLVTTNLLFNGGVTPVGL